MIAAVASKVTFVQWMFPLQQASQKEAACSLAVIASAQWLQSHLLQLLQNSTWCEVGFVCSAVLASSIMFLHKSPSHPHVIRPKVSLKSLINKARDDRLAV